MISRKNIVIIAVILILLIAATIFVVKWDGPAPQEEPEVSANVTKIYECNQEDIARIVVTNPDEKIEFVRLDADNWQITGLEDAAVKNFSIGILASDLSSISAKSTVTEKADNLAAYGLEFPANTVEVFMSDGSSKMFLSGDATALGDGYYFKDKDSDVIYTIYSTLHSSIFASLDDYRDTANLFIDREKIVGVKVEKSDYTLNLQLMDEPITMGGYNIATWEMTQPDYNTIDTSRLTTYVMDVLPTVTLSSVVGGVADYAEYGLDNPYAVITVTNLDGSVQTIKLGKIADDVCYVLADDNTEVYQANSSAFTFVDVDPFLLINKFVNIVNIDDVSMVTVSDSAAEYVLSIEGDGDNKKYLFGGKKIDETVFKTDLYQQVIGLTVDEFCSDANYSAPDVTIEYKLKDGTTSKVEFVNYNDRNYAVYKDGECKFIILKKSVNSVVETLKTYK